MIFHSAAMKPPTRASPIARARRRRASRLRERDHTHPEFVKTFLENYAMLEWMAHISSSPNPPMPGEPARQERQRRINELTRGAEQLEQELRLACPALEMERSSGNVDRTRALTLANDTVASTCAFSPDARARSPFPRTWPSFGITRLPLKGHDGCSGTSGSL